MSVADYRASLWGLKRNRKPKTAEQRRVRRDELQRRREEKTGRKRRKAEGQVEGRQGEADEVAVDEHQAKPEAHVLAEATPSDVPAQSSLGQANIPPRIPHASASDPIPRRSGPPSRPAVLDHVTIGINAVVKTLEDFVRSGRAELGSLPSTRPVAKGAQQNEHKKGSRKNTGRAAKKVANAKLKTAAEEEEVRTEAQEPLGAQAVADPGAAQIVRRAVPSLRLIFVCRNDLDPTSLVAHVPAVVAASNEMTKTLRTLRAEGTLDPASVMQVEEPAAQGDAEWAGQAWLVQLAEGAEQKVADALGLRRVAAVALDVSFLCISRHPVGR